MNRNNFFLIQYRRHLLTQKQRLEELKQKLKRYKIETGRDYLVAANGVFGKRRHQARARVRSMRYSDR